MPTLRFAHRPLFWLLWSLLISAIYWALGPHSYMRIQDNTDFNIPYRIAAARDLWEYGLTYWQPKFAGGMPAMVHPLFDSFLVDGLPFLLLPGWAAYGLIMWLQRFLAGYFTYRLCRDLLRMETAGALFAGLAFSLYFWNVRDMNLVDALGLPATAMWFLWFERLLGRNGWTGWALAGLLGVLLGLVSQSVLFTFFLVAGLPVWLWIARRIPWRAMLPRWGTFALGACLAEAPQLIALLAYRPVTARGLTVETAASWGELASHAWEVVGWSALPQNGLFLGLLGAGLLLGRDPVGKNLAWRLLALHLLSGVGAELLYGLQRLLAHLVSTSSGNARDFNQFTLFLGPLLGGVGLHLLASATPRLARTIRVVILCALALPVLDWLHITRLLALRLPSDHFAINFTDPLLADLAQSHPVASDPYRVATAGTWPPTVASASGGRLYPAYAFAYGLESADGYYRLHSVRYHRFWRQVIAKALSHYPAMTEKTIKWYYLFHAPEPRFAPRAPLTLENWYNLDLLSLANTRFLISHWPLDHPALVLRHEPTTELAAGRAWDALRIREQIRRTLTGDVPRHAIHLYENTEVLPRAFLAEKTRLFADATTLLDELARTPAAELHRTAFLEAPDAAPAANLSGGTVTLQRYTPDRSIWRVVNDGPGLLVVTNNHDPYWRVTVNGTPGRIMPVDHAFQGIALAAGENQVVLEYWPPYRR
ncbi:MAG: hypothetical protein HQM03_12375 [Magnetococcales bacterium]|nr:hypothetical protein [Magnetococcales bacterium]